MTSVVKDVLSDMMRQVGPLFEAVKVTGSDTGTRVEAHTSDKTLFLIAELKDAVPEFSGEFGIGSLMMLNGLLNFPSYKTDDAKFLVHRTKRDDLDFVSEFQFKDAKSGSTRFKTMNPRLVGEQATIKNVVWDLSLEPSKAKIAEIGQLASLMSEVGKMFGLKVEDGQLLLTMGGDSEVRHAAVVTLTENDTEVSGDLINTNPFYYNLTQLLSILKNAGNGKSSVKFCSRGVIGVVVETDKGMYTFYLRGKPDQS